MEQRIFAQYISDRQECEAIVHQMDSGMMQHVKNAAFSLNVHSECAMAMEQRIVAQYFSDRQECEAIVFSRYITDLRKATNSDA
jgi:hypothetical protein